MDFKFNIGSDQFRKVEASLKADIEAIIRSPAVLNAVGETVVERLKYQARVGKPFNESGVFPALKDSTIAHRKYLARYNPTHPTYAAKRSNLTITGEFLNSMKHVISGETAVTIFFDGTHPAYIGKLGRPVSKPIDNAKLFDYLSEKGFKVFDSSIQQNETLKKRIQSIVSAFIRRGLSVRNRLGK